MFERVVGRRLAELMDRSQIRVAIQINRGFGEQIKAGKTVPFALIGFVDVLLITTVATLWFQVPIRGIFLKGIGMDILWPQMLALLIIGIFTLWLAAKRLQKTLV